MKTLVLFLSLVLNVAMYMGGAQLAGWHAWQTMAALAALNFIAILCHELGHAFAFRHVGGRVHKIVVLFIAYDVTKRRFGRSRLPHGGDVGGYVAGSFRPEGPTIRDQIIVSAGGPAANVATGLIAAIMAWLIGPATLPDLGNWSGAANVDAVLAHYDNAVRAFEWHQFGYAALVLFASLSMGFALLNLLPYGGSDGQTIVRALKMRKTLRGR